ncbi:E4 [Alphapapillomavirus 3]|uniref:E4 n=1 Tax=Alphapapillomavirus 3 TaxID=333767 RepID=A0A2D2AKU5_9PAPI|nr:E4 [Alphapapillomavirus 3]
MNPAPLYLAPRTPCQKYPLLQLLGSCQTPTNPPPPPPAWAPPRLPPQCRRRLVSDSESTETDCSGSPTLPKQTSTDNITVQTTGTTVTVTARNPQGTSVTVTVHL